jgi:Pyrroline-5-carboxylate reductase
LPREALLLSTRGGAESTARLHEAGLTDRLAPAEQTAASGRTIVAVRPDSIGALAGLPFGKGESVLFCVAALPLAEARRIAGEGAARAMTSGPDTILEGAGLAAICPAHAPCGDILDFLGLRVTGLDDESLMDAFTAAVCMPAAVALLGDESLADLEMLASDLPELAQAFAWAPDVLPSFRSDEERLEYVNRMVTPGGVTERIVSSIRSGLGAHDAFYEGVARSREIASSLQRRGC